MLREQFKSASQRRKPGLILMSVAARFVPHNSGLSQRKWLFHILHGGFRAVRSVRLDAVSNARLNLIAPQYRMKVVLLQLPADHNNPTISWAFQNTGAIGCSMLSRLESIRLDQIIP